ncbi:permease [Shewanella waksmanii]|uniref:permease n=1 Tax=Shewanella waksmanii TaxID=213783 RepID=UPI00048B315D|nr:permease [Shewanella waksmanii]
MSPETLAMAYEAADMFVFLAVELTLLFLAISYLVGVLQMYITPEKIQTILSSKNGKGYVIAALLGSITPFCSCSTIPFLKGLLRAKAGFGPMMVFLFSSPLLNPIIIGLFVVTFGWQVALFYFAVALVVSIIAGWALEKLGFERYVKPEAYEAAGVSGCRASTGCGEPKAKAVASTVCCGEPQPKVSSCGDSAKAPLSATVAESSCGDSAKSTPTATSCAAEEAKPQAAQSCYGSEDAPKATPNKWLALWHSTWKDFKQVLPYLLLGITLGSFIYGFMPTELIVKYAGDGLWYAIPVAAVIGIPLYIRAEAVIPLSAALVKKGMALGSVMALIIGSAGASLTEVILLKSIFKNQMIIAFVSVILTMAIGAGFMYQWLFS